MCYWQRFFVVLIQSYKYFIIFSPMLIECLILFDFTHQLITVTAKVAAATGGNVFCRDYQHLMIVTSTSPRIVWKRSSGRCNEILTRTWIEQTMSLLRRNLFEVEKKCCKFRGRKHINPTRVIP